MEEKKVEKNELVNYAKHFDSNLAYKLLKKLRKETRGKPKIIAGATGAIVTVLGTLLSAWNNPETPASLKALVIGAIGYILLPIDLIADVIPVVGYTDDLASAGAVVAGVTKYCNFKLSDLDREIDEEEGLFQESDDEELFEDDETENDSIIDIDESEELYE